MRRSESRDILTIIPSPSVESVTAASAVGTMRDGVLERVSSQHQQKNLFLRMDRPRFRTNSVRSLRPVLPDLPCLLCLTSLASGSPRRSTFPLQPPTRLLWPHPQLVSSPCIRPLNLWSTGLLPTPSSCARPAGISATFPPLAP